MNNREAFEKEWDRIHRVMPLESLFKLAPNGEYEGWITQQAFTLWQAAKAQDAEQAKQEPVGRKSDLEPSDMASDYLLDLAFQLMGRASNLNCSVALHNRAFALKAEVANRLNCSPNQAKLIAELVEALNQIKINYDISMKGRWLSEQLITTNKIRLIIEEALAKVKERV
jgi:hypothetical protein